MLELAAIAVVLKLFVMALIVLIPVFLSPRLFWAFHAIEDMQPQTPDCIQRIETTSRSALWRLPSDFLTDARKRFETHGTGAGIDQNCGLGKLELRVAPWRTPSKNSAAIIAFSSKTKKKKQRIVLVFGWHLLPASSTTGQGCIHANPFQLRTASRYGHTVSVCLFSGSVIL